MKRRMFKLALRVGFATFIALGRRRRRTMRRRMAAATGGFGRRRPRIIGRRGGMGAARRDVGHGQAKSEPSIGWGMAGSMLAGAAMMYLFDPTSGLRRRRGIADGFTRFRKRLTHALTQRATDLGNRSRGFVAGRVPSKAAASDEVLEARLKSELGHVLPHAHIDVQAHEGHVVLSGHAAIAEAERLLKRARKVRGVTDVTDKIETDGGA